MFFLASNKAGEMNINIWEYQWPLLLTKLDNGLSPGRRQANIWTNAEILLIGTLEQTSMKF